MSLFMLQGLRQWYSDDEHSRESMTLTPRRMTSHVKELHTEPQSALSSGEQEVGIRVLAGTWQALRAPKRTGCL